MNLPFTQQEFLQVFSDYNIQIWPLQILFYIFAVIAFFLSVKKSKYSDFLIVSILVFFWLWMGVVYHPLFFSSINKAAWLFGILFIVQALLLFYSGIIRYQLSFSFKNDLKSLAGLLLIAYALIIYPLTGIWLDHHYPASPTFGLPCPTTIFTFGILLFVKNKIPFIILVIPLLWSVIGFTAAFKLGIYEDVVLPVSALVTLGVNYFGHKREAKVLA